MGANDRDRIRKSVTRDIFRQRQRIGQIRFEGDHIDAAGRMSGSER